MTAPLHRLAIADIAAGVADPRAVLAAYLDRIARFDGAIAAYTHMDADGARAAAAESAARIERGEARPLEGAPIAVKANIDVAGWPTTAGVAHRRHAIATTDAPVIAALRDAGAIILGQVNMHEAALGAITDNEAYGRTMNPHRIGFTPGGSSGGSGAAVAAGLCVAALGTDTLGSVRIPAAYNGVYGLKPTNGLVPDAGLVYLARRLDSIGPLARSLDDVAAVMAAMAALDDTPPAATVATLAGVDSYEAMQPAVRSAFQGALRALIQLGLTVTRVATPGLDLTAARMGGFVESAREAAITFAEDRAQGGISRAFAASLDYGAAATPEVLAAGDAAVAVARDAMLNALADADVICMPTSPQAAFAHGGHSVTQADFTALANLAGLPSLSLPAGIDADGLPVAIQLVGRPRAEATLIELGRRLDRALGAYQPPADYA